MKPSLSVQSPVRYAGLLPVLFSFFVMGFVDIVGTATANIKAEMGLSNALAGLLPNFIFVWFVVCSIPVGLMMNRIGRRATVQISNCITIAGMLTPLPMILGLMPATLAIYLVTFALLGIGNTMVQVALNPLLTNVVSGDRLAGSMTLGQFVKALSSLLGPQIVLFATVQLGNWAYVFPIYAGITALSSAWLALAPIPREAVAETGSQSFAGAFSLLRDPYLLRLFFCILLIVGIDVGMNFFIPIIFHDVFGLEHASNINTLYFAARAVGSFVCALLLTRYAASRILLRTMIAAIAAYLAMMGLAATPTSSMAVKALFCVLFLPVGFATANVFSIVFSFAIRHRPEQADLISSLLIMGVAGGGAVTFAMGLIADNLGIVGGMSVLLLCMLYLLVTARYIRRREQQHP